MTYTAIIETILILMRILHELHFYLNKCCLIHIKSIMWCNNSIYYSHLLSTNRYFRFMFHWFSYLPCGNATKNKIREIWRKWTKEKKVVLHYYQTKWSANCINHSCVSNWYTMRLRCFENRYYSIYCRWKFSKYEQIKSNIELCIGWYWSCNNNNIHHVIAYGYSCYVLFGFYTSIFLIYLMACKTHVLTLMAITGK